MLGAVHELSRCRLYGRPRAAGSSPALSGHGTQCHHGIRGGLATGPSATSARGHNATGSTAARGTTWRCYATLLGRAAHNPAVRWHVSLGSLLRVGEQAEQRRLVASSTSGNRSVLRAVPVLLMVLLLMKVLLLQHQLPRLIGRRRLSGGGAPCCIAVRRPAGTAGRVVLPWRQPVQCPPMLRCANTQHTHAPPTPQPVDVAARRNGARRRQRQKAISFFLRRSRPLLFNVEPPRPLRRRRARQPA